MYPTEVLERSISKIQKFITYGNNCFQERQLRKTDPTEIASDSFLSV